MVTINGERYLVTQWKPRVLFQLTLGVVRLVVWGPFLFVSVTVGLPAKDGPGGKAYAAQAYLGVKCDPTKTYEHPGTGYWMRVDWYECLAARVHPVAIQPEWSDPGGS